jgi:hypothetical protein
MADGFLGRWSKRKLAANDGRPLAPEPVVAEAAASRPETAIPAQVGIPAHVGIPVPGVVPAPVVIPAQAGIQGVAAPASDEPAAPPPLTLDDAHALTPESDFRPFAARTVDPAVRNAAMKKLFSDPHFNVMDRLDTYIDDYSQPDPIPREMLRQLASGKFLGLFREEEEQEARAAQEEAARRGREVADDPTGETVAKSAAAPAVPEAPSDDDDPDLRLQQDHAPPGAEPGGGAA